MIFLMVRVIQIMIKVSIIIPVYNVEKYIPECLDSVINQSLKEIEIICVDDCSTDNSYNILLEYAKKDNRIKIIKHDKNKGLGPARNTGLNESVGEYICFIDSDDYVSLDFTSELYKTAKNYNTDLVNTLNIYKNIDGQISYLWCNIHYLEKNYDISNIPEYIIEDNDITKYISNKSKYCISYSAWNKLYRRRFLLDNNLFFMDIKFGSEDADFNMRVVLNTPRTAFNNKAKYYYRDRADSLMKFAKVSLESRINSIEHMNNIINYCKNNYESFLYNSLFIIKVWHPPFYLFSISNMKNQEEFYPYIYKFSNSIYLEYKPNYNSDEKIEYEEYILIRGSKTYNEYLFNKHNLNLNKSIHKRFDLLQQSNINRFKLFDIKNENNYLLIIILGIKISIKKKK